MLEAYNPSSQLKYQKLSADEQKKRGILGRLVGIMADFKHPTRNGRLYPEKLWDKVFQDDIMKEKIANRCVFGELGHPEDRTDIDMEKIAICLAEQPKKGTDGNLYGVFDILNTPNGKILKTLCDYGCQIGISSRGQGDTYTDYNGTETVDADSYDCVGWDAVILPAVKTARLKVVNESLNSNNEKTLKEALMESFNSSSDEDKKIMQETWNLISEAVYPEDTVINDEKKDDEKEILNDEVTEENIESEEDNIDINQSLEDSQIVEPSEEDVNDIEVSDESADDIGEEIIEELQKALEEKIKLQKQVKELQEKLSVCYAKENRLEGKLSVFKNKITSDADNSKLIESLNAKVTNLTKELNTTKTQLTEKCKELDETKSGLQLQLNNKNALHESVNETHVKSINELKESLADSKNKLALSNKKLAASNTKLEETTSKLHKVQNLLESNTAKTNELKNTVENLNIKIDTLNEQLISKDTESKKLLQSIRKESDLKIQSLTEDFEIRSKEQENKFAEMQKDSSIRNKNLNEKLEKQKQLTDKYKKLAKKTVDKYIESEASKIGVKPIEITNRLSESYTFADIENVCQELQKQSLRLNNLPFNTNLSSAKVSMKESVDPLVANLFRTDDVDDQLLRMAGIHNK